MNLHAVNKSFGEVCFDLEGPNLHAVTESFREVYFDLEGAESACTMYVHACSLLF